MTRRGLRSPTNQLDVPNSGLGFRHSSVIRPSSLVIQTHVSLQSGAVQLVVWCTVQIESNPATEGPRLTHATSLIPPFSTSSQQTLADRKDRDSKEFCRLKIARTVCRCIAYRAGSNTVERLYRTSRNVEVTTRRVAQLWFRGALQSTDSSSAGGEMPLYFRGIFEEKPGLFEIQGFYRDTNTCLFRLERWARW